jgi:hypothetical protein
MSDFKDKRIHPLKYLVEPIPDYYNRSRGGFSSKVMNATPTDAGIIRKVGDGLDSNELGKIIYYPKNVGTSLEVRGVGVYQLIHSENVLMVRMDEDEHNYKQLNK